MFCLRNNLPLPSNALSSVAKGLNDAKSPVRRAFCLLAGDALWQLRDLSSASAQAFAQAVIPSLENSLKAVATSPASAPAGPLEGYIAAAAFLGPIHQSGMHG